MGDPQATAEEYRIAYQQVRLQRKRLDETLELMERDLRLALQRYRRARAAYIEIALGEEDQVVAELESEGE